METVVDVKPQDMHEIAQLIAAFDASTAKLKASHDALQGRIAELTGELTRKNEALSATLTEVSALKNYLANILESITDGVVAIDLERRIVALNEAAADAIPGLAPEREGRFVLEVLPASCRALGALLMRALSEERRFTNEQVQFPGRDGRPRTLSVSASPIRSENGVVLGAVETFRDLTEIKALEERAARQDRLAALGEMAAGVAHEIRNPLGGIALYASHLKRGFAAGSKESEISERIIAAATSLNQIVTDMLTFTRSREPVRRSVPVEHVVGSALEMAATALAEKGIVVERAFATGGEKVALDADLMGRAFLNVVLNAVHAMEPGKTLTVETRFETAAGGPRVLLVAFRDQGPGVPAEARECIFNPFVSLRRDGTGLGLAIVNKIVQDHGGAVWVEDNVPAGAVFWFRLPAP